ncbi:hypothetical protein L1987_85695 [Smallanthus sonchifolius]|uniref:Uncharacterized protein n=1 Tax=Smallanthus sonchifolius TaxID=185202 RepID=A0ACB8XXG6_9ASTR|nr:hypothetical protein L1987_85695 [Smallanthus sonchifolius]
MKRVHDAKIRLKTFAIGQKVWLFNSRLKLFPGKLKSKWTGPYLVTKVGHSGHIEIEDFGDHLRQTVNGHWLKPYLEPNDINGPDKQVECREAFEFFQDFVGVRVNFGKENDGESRSRGSSRHAKTPPQFFTTHEGFGCPGIWNYLPVLNLHSGDDFRLPLDSCPWLRACICGARSRMKCYTIAYPAKSTWDVEEWKRLVAELGGELISEEDVGKVVAEEEVQGSAQVADEHDIEGAGKQVDQGNEGNDA